MGRSYRCEKDGLSKGAWTALEDQILIDYVKDHGEGRWGKLSRETGEPALTLRTKSHSERSRNEWKTTADTEKAVPSLKMDSHLIQNGLTPTSCMNNKQLGTTNTLAEPFISGVEATNMEAKSDSSYGFLPITRENDMTRNFIRDLNAGELGISEFLHTDFSKLCELNTTIFDCTSGCRNGSLMSTSTAEAPLYLQEWLNDWAADDNCLPEAALGP
ncbi:hypothetical protein ACE6H2_004104 [Prunus campanulata]